MSFEGYYQLICENGHYYQEGLYGEEDNALCSICGAKAVWWNLVDITNGSHDEDGKQIDGYVNLKVKDKKVCEHCNSTLELIYEIPKIGVGHVKGNEVTNRYCSSCGYAVQSEMYETGMEDYCNCQCTLDAEFNPELWYDE